MDLIYANLDGLDISFQGAIPELIRAVLRTAKIDAQANRSDSMAELGPNNLVVSVKESGAKGGYHFIVDTGLIGMTWFIADNDDKELWNIRVSCKSLLLATRSYEEVKEMIFAYLKNDFCAIGHELISEQTGEIINRPFERISRFDFCYDFISNEFEINPSLLMSHNRNKTDYIYAPVDQVYETARKVAYVRIGKMPNRQLVIYNKIQDVNEKRKFYWYKIWGINQKELKRDNKIVWRVEVRAGKKELNKWDIRQFNDFEDKAHLAVRDILKSLRYMHPNLTDKNKSRWKMAQFWENAISNGINVFGNTIPEKMRKEIQENEELRLQNMFENNVKGNLIGLAATRKIELSQIPGVIGAFKNDFSDELLKNPDKLKKKFEKSKLKIRNLNN